VTKFTYIDAMVIDTPIIYDTMRSKINYIKPIAERLKRAKLFGKKYQVKLGVIFLRFVQL